MELRDVLTSLDESPASAPSAETAIVIALPPGFAGQTPSLIRRRRLGGPLIITSSRGELRLSDWSFIDDCRPLGWRRVEIQSDWRAAVHAAYHAVSAAGRVVVCWPAWVEPAVEAGDLASFIARIADQRRAAGR